MNWLSLLLAAPQIIAEIETAVGPLIELFQKHTANAPAPTVANVASAAATTLTALNPVIQQISAATKPAALAAK